jgi:flagellar motor switch protein FliG
MSQENNTGTYINGKKQVVDLLKMMSGPEKATLLKNLKLRNPALAKELMEQCLNFETVWELTDDQLRALFAQCKPIILGLALYLTTIKNQRKALSLVSRDTALQAYEIMTKDLSSHRHECIKAQEKMVEILKSLHAQRIVNLY